MAHDQYLVTAQQWSYCCKYQIETALAIMAKNATAYFAITKFYNRSCTKVGRSLLKLNILGHKGGSRV